MTDQKKPTPKPIYKKESGLKTPRQIDWNKIFGWSGAAFTSLVVILTVAVLIWYNVMLSPLGGDRGVLKKITIKAGSNSSQIGKVLQDQGVIRSSFVFDIYVKLSGKNSVLQAGTYRLSPAESTQQIVQHFVNGSKDNYNITFYPGSTLSDIAKVKGKKYDVTSVLEEAGFSDSEIKVALNKSYDSPLFINKPAGTSLEGYVFGDTYSFNIGASVQDILQKTFDEYYQQLQDNDIIAGFSRHGLNLYQGITLASIVQREASTTSDQRQVAQVFYSRLALGMPLGSDVTYQYAADKMGVPRDPALNSPYNTRIFKGLPPGPIATPGLSALKAVANPASGDYLYFLSGDDNVTYFARTDAEHQANIAAHCKVKCSIL